MDQFPLTPEQAVAIAANMKAESSKPMRAYSLDEIKEKDLACKWGGGNDYLTCRTCGAEYDPGKIGEETEPSCEIARLFPRIDSVWRHYNGNVYYVVEIGNRSPERQSRYATRVWYRNLHTDEPFDRLVTDWKRSMTKLADSREEYRKQQDDKE